MENVATNKIAHFNIPDLHAFHSLANRLDYYSEILSIVERFGLIVNKYRRMGYKCIALYNGDVAHRGSTSDALNDKAVQIIKYMNSHFDECYVNFGNHEFTYYKNNPILKFIKEIEDVRITESFPNIQGTSLTPDIRVVAELSYEDFEIGFTPYGFLPMAGTKEIKHMVMHDDLMSANAYNRLAVEVPNYKFTTVSLAQDTFDYVYCGHAHLVSEKWQHGKTTIYNMASLGRSSVSEIKDEMRSRTIPIILSENGYFKEVAEETITLHRRADVVDEEKLLKSQEAYQAVKRRKLVREALTLHQSMNPLEALMEDIELSGDPYMKAIMDIVNEGRLVRFRDVRNYVEASYE